MLFGVHLNFPPGKKGKKEAKLATYGIKNDNMATLTDWTTNTRRSLYKKLSFFTENGPQNKCKGDIFDSCNILNISYLVVPF